MAADIPLEYSLVIKILEEYKHKNSLKRFLKETNLINEYKQNKIENINFISLNIIKKSIKKSIKKCSSLSALGVYKSVEKEEGGGPPEEKNQNVSSNPGTKKTKKRNRTSNAIKNNSKSENKVDSFASKAASDLENIRGKQFRNEKNKKKRSSWKGSGAISTGVNSIVFEDSD